MVELASHQPWNLGKTGLIKLPLQIMLRQLKI